MKTKKQHKLPRFREASWGPLIYSSAEQTEHLCSSFSSSPKQLCQKLKFAFLTLFFLRGKLFLQWLKALLPSSSVVLVWILKKKRLVLVSPLLNKPSKGNSFLPQELWPHLGHIEREGGRNCDYSPPQPPGDEITGSTWETQIPSKRPDMRKAPKIPCFSGIQKHLVNNCFGFVEDDKENQELVSIFKSNQLCI